MRPIASHGARGLIRLGFGLDRDDSRFEGLRQRFLDLYDTHYADDTVLFDGVPELIDSLARAGWLAGHCHQQTDALYRQAGARLAFPLPAGSGGHGDTVGVPSPTPNPCCTPPPD